MHRYFLPLLLLLPDSLLAAEKPPCKVIARAVVYQHPEAAPGIENTAAFNHGPSIALPPNGHLLAVWFSSVSEGHDSQRIMRAVSTDLGLSWSKAETFGVDGLYFDTFHGGNDGTWAPTRACWSEFSRMVVTKHRPPARFPEKPDVAPVWAEGWLCVKVIACRNRMTDCEDESFPFCRILPTHANHEIIPSLSRGIGRVRARLFLPHPAARRRPEWSSRGPASIHLRS